MEKLNYSLVQKVEYIEHVLIEINKVRCKCGVPFICPSEILRFIPDSLKHDEVSGDVTFFQLLEIGDDPESCYNNILTLKYLQNAFWTYTNFRKEIVGTDIYANRCLNYVIRVLRDCLLNRLPFQYHGIVVNSFYKMACAPL